MQQIYASLNRASCLAAVVGDSLPSKHPTDGRNTPLKKIVHCSFRLQTQHVSWCRLFSAPHQKHLTILYTLPPKEVGLQRQVEPPHNVTAQIVPTGPSTAIHGENILRLESPSAICLYPSYTRFKRPPKKLCCITQILHNYC